MKLIDLVVRAYSEWPLDCAYIWQDRDSELRCSSDPEYDTYPVGTGLNKPLSEEALAFYRANPGLLVGDPEFSPTIPLVSFPLVTKGQWEEGRLKLCNQS